MKRLFGMILLLAVAFPMTVSAEVNTQWRAGILRYFETTTGETLDVVAPVKIFENYTRPVGLITTVTTNVSFAAVNSGSLKILSATGGEATVTLGAADNDDAEIATELIFWSGKFCAAEARVALSTTTCGFNFGFTDAKDEIADKMPCDYATATLTSTASNCAVFFYDSDATTDDLYCVSVKDDTDGTVTDTGTAGAAGTYHVYRVEIDDSGNCDFYLDGVHIYQEATGISTHVPLCGYLGFIRRDGATGSVTGKVSYLRVWQKR